MEGVEETRNENTDGLTQQDNQAGYPQTALGTYNQTNTVPNGHGAEQVSIRGVQQVIENRPDVQNETHVGLADDRGHLSISNVPGGVQVAVVPSTDDVRVVDGSLASAASTVEGTDDGTHTVVTAMPAEYGLPGALQAQYVLQEEHEGKTFVFLDLSKLKFGELDGFLYKAWTHTVVNNLVPLKKKWHGAFIGSNQGHPALAQIPSNMPWELINTLNC